MSTITTVRAHQSYFSFNLKELLAYYELLFVFIQRDIKLRYRQTVIGGLWAIIQPFATMIAFTILFGNTAKIFNTDVPYSLFSYAGLLLWTYFASSVANASNSMLNNAHLITKVYFPRIIIPISATLTGLLDYAIASIMMFGLLLFYKVPLTPAIIFIPVVVFLTWLLSTGMGLWLASLNVKYRDIRYALPFFIQLMIFLTPVIYPLQSVGKYRWLLNLNPMSGFIELHRGLFLGNIAVDITMILTSIVLTAIIFITGYMYFKSVEHYIADTI